MTSTLDVALLIIAALVLANLPWLNERLFTVIKRGWATKPFLVRLLEWGVGFGLVAFLAWRIELGCLISPAAFFGLTECPGDIHPKTWEFYSVVLVLYAVFALPGFIYFVERRRARPANAEQTKTETQA